MIITLTKVIIDGSEQWEMSVECHGEIVDYQVAHRELIAEKLQGWF